MTCRETAREFALLQATELEAKAASIGILRSVDATEAAKWLNEIAAAIREAAGPSEPQEVEAPALTPSLYEPCLHPSRQPHGRHETYVSVGSDGDSYVCRACGAHAVEPKTKIEVSKTMLALYFGYGSGGHFLRGGQRNTIDPQKDVPGFPWSIDLLDTGLLQNRKVPDDPDGRVHWTGGGRSFWFAFFWWDRSGDKRGASNSGFYVQGFRHTESRAAFAYACQQWPDVVARQLHPLVLVDLSGQGKAK